MNDVDKKVQNLVEKINIELRQMGSDTKICIDKMVTEDTQELYHTIEVHMGACAYLAYSSPNWVGIKTFLQGSLVIAQLVSGNYRLKPLSELARRQMPVSIIPRLLQQNVVGPEPSRKKKAIKAISHPRFILHRNKYRMEGM